MTRQQLTDWLEALKTAWETRNPNAAADLCAEKFIWYETPFSEPLKTREQLLKEWQSVLKQEDISVSYEILCTDEHVGIAQWEASFIMLPMKEKMTFNGIMKISLDTAGKCTEFRQWFNTKK